MNDVEEKKIRLIGSILKDIHEVLLLFHPILEKLKTEENINSDNKNDILKRAKRLFRDISEKSKEILEKPSQDLLKSFLN